MLVYEQPWGMLQVTQWDVAADIVEDYDAGLEYCEAECILKSVQKGDEREYLVRCAAPFYVCWCQDVCAVHRVGA